MARETTVARSYTGLNRKDRLQRRTGQETLESGGDETKNATSRARGTRLAAFSKGVLLYQKPGTGFGSVTSQAIGEGEGRLRARATGRHWATLGDTGRHWATLGEGEPGDVVQAGR